MWKISIYLSDLAKKSVTFLSDWDLSAALSWAWWLGWWMLPPGHGETWDSQTENHEILPNYSEFDLFMFVFSISNNLCLAQQLLNTTLVSSLPCFLFISARRRPLVAELGWVQVRFSDTNNCLRLPGPQESRPATALTALRVWCLCVFLFLSGLGIIRRHQDYQTASRACLSLYHSVSEYPPQNGDTGLKTQTIKWLMIKQKTRNTGMDPEI